MQVVECFARPLPAAPLVARRKYFAVVLKAVARGAAWLRRM
jgi:hypothetical protein